MNAFILMLGTIGAAVWSAWAFRMDQADADSAIVADAAEDEWLGL